MDTSASPQPGTRLHRPRRTASALVFLAGAAVAATASPDLGITKAGPSSVAAGDTIVYRIEYWNAGPDAANQVVVTDVLPAGVTFIDASDGGTESGGTVTWTRPLLSGDRRITHTVRVLAPACPATLLNTATVTSVGGDANLADNTASAGTVVSGAPCGADVAIEKSGPLTAGTGDTIVYTIRAASLGPGTATDVGVVDVLPAGVTFLDASHGVSPSNGVLTWPGRSLAVGEAFEYTVRVLAPDCPAVIENFAQVQSAGDRVASNDVSTVSTTVTGPACVTTADVVLEKTGPLAADPGDTITFTLRVWNEGPSTALDVLVTDSLPEDHGFVSATGGGVLAGRVLTWPRILRLAVGDTVEFGVTVLIAGRPASGAYANVGRASSLSPADPDTTNNRDDLTVLIRLPTADDPDIDVTKAAVGEFRADQTGRFRIDISNTGNGPTVAPVLLTDSLPAGFTYVSAQGQGWVIAGSGRLVDATFAGVLQPGESTSLEVTVSVDAAAAGEYCNVVRVTTAQDTASVANNRAVACVTVPAGDEAAVELVKSADRPDVVIGSTVEYRLTATVTGTLPLTDVTISDRLPHGFGYESGSARRDGVAMADPGRGSSKLLVFELGAVSPGERVVIAYTARAGPASAPGDAVNRARANWTGGSSNEASVTIRVTPGVFSDEGMIAGTVFADSVSPVSGQAGECVCPESDRVQRGERGIPGVRVMLQDGTAAITDSEGRYLFAALGPRTWVVKVDRSTLPDGVRLHRLTSRHGGDGSTVLVDLKKGELHRADFAAAWSGSGVAEAIEARRAGLEALASDPWLASPVPEAGGRPTGLAAGIPWTRYELLLPETWRGRAHPADGPLSRVAGFPLTPDDTVTDRGSVRPRIEPADPRSAAQPRPGPTGVAETELAIGLVEARLDFRSASDATLGGSGRDAFEDALKNVSFDEDDGRVRGGTRAALFYRGRAAGRYDLTLRLDSEEDERARLFRDITPDDFYPIGGDASAKGFGARSRSRVYARVGTGDTWLMWGDFNTGRAPERMAGVRSLGEYARTLNGALQHWEGDRFALDAFASRDRSAQVVDVIRAEGVSGPYRLSRSDALVNSERVELVTRLRDQPAVVLRTHVLERYTDYTLEPLTGRLIFNRPVPAFDENLDPVEIRVTYEVEGDTERFWVWGANARFRPLGGLEIGGTLARDETPLAPFELGSLNATVDLPGETWLTGEIARTGGRAREDGDATRVELLHMSGPVSLRGFHVATDTTFANPASGYAPGREELGLLAALRFDDKTYLFTDLFASEDRRTEIRRRGARVGLDRALRSWLGAQVGFRWASTDGAATAADDTRALGVRLRTTIPGEAGESERGTAFAEFEQDVSESNRRRVAIGADYRVLPGVRLYARHEFINSLSGPWHLDAGLDRNATVFGVATEGRAGQAVFSEYRVRAAIDGREAQAVVGLRNSWRVSEGVRLSASLERLTPIGTGTGDATAVTGAAEFTGSTAWKGSIRSEYQAAEGGDNLFGSIGYVRRLSPAFSFLGNSVFSTLVGGGRAWSRTRLGIAYRHVDANRWNGLARYEHRYDRSGGDLTSPRRWNSSHILAAHADFQPVRSLLLRGQWTSRLTVERNANGTTNGSAHLAGGRGTLDLGRLFDLGVIGRTLFAGDGTRFGLGAEIGVRLPSDLRLAAGYNVFGFREDVGDDQTDRGAYIQLAFRFDEGLWRDVPREPQPGSAECRCPAGEDPERPPPDRPEPRDPDPLADLELLIVGPTHVRAGDVFAVEMRARNRPRPGGEASGVAGSASVSRGAAFVDPAGGPDRTRLPLPIDDFRLAAGQQRSERLLIRAPLLAGGVHEDSIFLDAAIAAVPNEADSLNNAGRLVIRVRPPLCESAGEQGCGADLDVWINGPHRTGQGDTIRYHVWTKNAGDAAAIDVVSRTSFPDLRRLAQDGDQGLSRRDTTVVVSPRLAPGDSVPWPLTLIAPGQPDVLTVETRSATASPEYSLANNEARKETFVPCSESCPGSLVLRTDGPVTASRGDTVRYAILSFNPGTDGLSRIDIGARAGQGSDVIRASSGAAAAGPAWLVQDLGPRRSHSEWVDLICSAGTIGIDVDAAAAGVNRRTSEVRTACLLSDLRVSITAMDTETRQPGDAVTWRIVTANAGPGAARLVRTRATLSAWVTFGRTSGGGEFRSDTVSWPVVDRLAPGDSVAHTLTIISSPTRDEAGVEALTETVTPESAGDNNRASLRTLLVPGGGLRVPDPAVGPIRGDGSEVGPATDTTAVSDLQIDIAPDVPDEIDGYTVRYRITATNRASTPARDVRVRVLWPERVRYVSDDRAGTASGDSVVFPPIPMLAAGASVSDRLVLLMPRAPDTAIIEAFASTATRELSPDDNIDTTIAVMQEVIIRDTTFVRDELWEAVIRLLPILLPGLLLLLLLVIGWIMWRFGWPPRRTVPAPGPGPDRPGPVDAPPDRPGPYLIPPVPPIVGLPQVCGPIEVGGVRGTAYLVRHDRLVTCSHVVLNRNRGDRVTVRLAGRVIEATIHAVAPQVDIAILRPTEPVRDVKPLELAPEGPAPAWWRGYGFPNGPDTPGIEFGGAMLQPSGHDRFIEQTMTLTGPGLAERFLDPSNGLAGSPVIVDGRVIGHLRGHVPHPDTLNGSFAGLLKAVPASRILELLKAGDDGRTPDRPPHTAQAEPPERQEWSLAPRLSARRDAARHADLVHRAADSELARGLADRLEGLGFTVRLAQVDGQPWTPPPETVPTFVLHSRAWADADRAPALPGTGSRPIIVRLDDSPLPEAWRTLDSIDFRVEGPDGGTAFSGLVRMLAGEVIGQDGFVVQLLEATESAIEIVRSARGLIGRTRFAVKRWRESGLPGHGPELVAAEQLLDAGAPVLALEIIDGVPAGRRAAQLAADALSRLGHIDDAIARLESLPAAVGDDPATIARLAGLYRRKWTEGGRRRVAWIRKALQLSSDTYSRTRDLRAGLDAALFALIAGEVDAANLLATEVREALSGRNSDGDGWSLLGMADLILGDDASAMHALERAVAAAPDAVERIGELHGRVRDIIRHRPDGPGPAGSALDERLGRLFYVPRVAALLPSSVDNAASERDARAELRGRLEELDVGLGICCPDTLPSVVFAEEVLRRGGRVLAILPLPRDLFLPFRIDPAAVRRVQSLLRHERTSVSHIAQSGTAGQTAELPDRSAGGVDPLAPGDALLEVGRREADLRVQRLVVFGAEAAGPAGPPDYLLEPDERGHEFVPLEVLDRAVSPAAPTRAPATAAAGAAPADAAPRTRDIMRIRRTETVTNEPFRYRQLHCIVIGIDQYTQWNPLLNAVNDANGLAGILESGYGFTVRRLIDAEATRDRVRALILEELPPVLDKDDLLVLFFAGHGHTERLADDEEHGFLVPVDARRDSTADLLPMEEVVAWAEHLPCEDVLYLFDSCFSGFAAFAGGVTKRGDSDDARIAISAGSAEQPVLDGGAPGGFEDHSVFTAYLLQLLTEALKTDGREVDAMRLFVELRDRVTKATVRKQTPAYGFLSGHGAGEIWFMPRGSRNG